jgi:hypothetical protein
MSDISPKYKVLIFLQKIYCEGNIIKIKHDEIESGKQ